MTTLHTVYQEMPEEHQIIYKSILSNSRQMIVHEPYQLEGFQGTFEKDLFDTILSAADVVVLPYKIISQSGILAHCLAFGKPLITSNSEAMRQKLAESGAGLTCNEPSEFVEKVVSILCNEELSKELSKNAGIYVRDEISWSRIAQLHLDSCRRLMDIPKIKTHVVLVE